MLRNFVLACGAAMLIAGAWLWSAIGAGPGLAIAGALVVVGVLFERRYSNTPPPGAQWQTTGERFTDPVTGEEVEVQYDPASGERRYRNPRT